MRRAKETLLAASQGEELPELELSDLPLPLHERVRYACANMLLYRWWYGLAVGALPPQMLDEWEGRMRANDPAEARH